MDPALHVGDYRIVKVSLEEYRNLLDESGITPVAWREIKNGMVECTVVVHEGFQKKFEYLREFEIQL